MNKEKVTVKFQTITPVWTGDAWGECKELKPSAIMGSLRFWFEVYCHFVGIEVKEKEELKYKKFRENLEKKFKKNPQQDIDELSFKIASQMLTLPSLIFGCTGWRSRVEIERIKYNDISLMNSDFDYNFLHSKENNTYWWSNKVLFNKKNEIKVIENATIDFLIDKESSVYFKKFLKFYQNKCILIGGKKAFGLGFVKLESNLDLNQTNVDKAQKSDYVIWDSICLKTTKKVLGFNIKYFLRKNENKKYKAKNFGKMSQASNYYFSIVNYNENNMCHIISFDPNKDNLEKYKNKILEENGNYSYDTQSNTEKTVNDLKDYFSNR